MSEFDTSLPPVRDYVAGEWVDPVETDQVLENPNTGDELQRVVRSRDEDIDRALETAAKVHDAGTWADTPIEERAAKLHAMADFLEERAMESARQEALTTGVTVQMTGMLSIITHGAWRMAAQKITEGVLSRSMTGMTGNEVEIHRRPWGPAVLLVPWNAPAPMAAHKAASSLAAGAPTILKPTEFAPNACTLIAEAAEAAGLPTGVFQVVHGAADVGSRLVNSDHTGSVSFTGGLQGGRAIAGDCAPRFVPTQLELGGNNPLVAMPDADAATLAGHVVNLMVQLNGQWCRALGRLILPADRADELLEAAIEALSGVGLGHSLDPTTQMGPMIHSAHLADIEAKRDALVAAGGEAHTTAALPDLPGNFISPTLVTGVSSKDAEHEIFGPVAAVLTYDTLDEALALANDTPYGLEGYVCGTDEEAAMTLGRGIRAGGVKVNGSTVLSLSLDAPRPAWGWSGAANEGTVETIEFFGGEQVVGIEGPMPDFG